MSSFNQTQSTASYYSTLLVKTLLMIGLAVVASFAVIAAGNVSEMFQNVAMVIALVALSVSYFFIALVD